jgi:SulP family sulfate permease
VLREGYSRRQFAHDLGAGIIVGIVALPLAIAFAIASGVGPERGLYTAVVAGFLISAPSSCWSTASCRSTATRVWRSPR